RKCRIKANGSARKKISCAKSEKPKERWCDTLLNEQGVRQRRCRSSGAQRTEAIGVWIAAGRHQLHHRAWREAFARRTGKASCGKHGQQARGRIGTNFGIGPRCRSSERGIEQRCLRRNGDSKR